MDPRRLWYGNHPVSVLLAPLGWLYCGLMTLRRRAYRWRLAPSYAAGAPVIVVGNITVGGAGKTPLVVWLADYLRTLGFTPAVVARGYGGQAGHWPQQVRPDSDPRMVGDEPVLVAARTDCPVAVAPDRVAAARGLVSATGCDVLISDDGLQHLRLRRDVEIVVVDGQRRFGNGRCLPVGPLREGRRRLKSVDLVVCNGASGLRGEHGMRLQATHAVQLVGEARLPLRDLRGQRVHVVAGIAFGQRFFDTLRGFGLEPVVHEFPDHHPFAPRDIDYADDLPVLMTEKDAVKCRRFADARHWYVPVTARLSDSFSIRLERLLRERGIGPRAKENPE